MIPKSTQYKLVRRSDNIIVAEGSKKPIEKLFKANKSVYYIGISSRLKVGDKFE